MLGAVCADFAELLGGEGVGAQNAAPERKKGFAGTVGRGEEVEQSCQGR